MEVSSKPQKKKIELKAIVRKSGPSAAKLAADAAAEREAKQVADYRKKLVGAISSAANGIPDSISSGTQVGFVGPGGDGVPYANFLAAVKTVYTRAWVLPDGVTDDDATVGATVTIARDGSVVSSKIIRRSRNSAVDASVQATLDRVTYAAPLPKTAKENTRTVEINFNVKAKKLIG
jgi:TonB family protein